MGVNKFNSEGYYDPTPYEALTAIERREKAANRRYRPIVYICSPFAGDPAGHSEKARRYCRFAVDSGFLPLAPHLYFPQFMDDGVPSERETAIFMNTVLLSKCSALWVFGKNISKGMRIEIERARVKGIPIRFFTEECKEETAQ